MGLANRISSPGTALTELVALAQPLATPRRPASGRIGLSSYGAQHLASPLPVSPGRLGRTPAARSSSDRRRYRRWGCALRVARRRPSRISQALLHELMHPRHVHPDLLGRQLAQHLRVHVDLEVLPRAGVIDVGLPVLRDQHERRQKDRLERDDEREQTERERVERQAWDQVDNDPQREPDRVHDNKGERAAKRVMASTTVLSLRRTWRAASRRVSTRGV